MMLGVSTNNLRAQLDDLSISTPPEPPGDQHTPVASTKSLLSKSLAGDRTRQPIPQAQHTFFMGDLADPGEHPEPSLLATSVGKDPDGRLIPSSSTISLLSLSNNGTNFNSASTYNSAYTNSAYNANAAPHNTHAAFNADSKGVAYGQMNPERVNSFTNLKSRNSVTHLSQQRFKSYQRLASPTVPLAAEFANFLSPQAIPIGRNQVVPDSPNLDPTSVTGSPSRFWLSSQTPPKSLANSLTKTRSHLGMGALQMTSPDHTRPTHSDVHAIAIAKTGSDSPILNPVQTPQEDLPMTPLYLSSETGGYFTLAPAGVQLSTIDEFVSDDAMNDS